MGCYGIGISRIVAAAIEQHHDERGILWLKAMAPFDVVLIPIAGPSSDKMTNVTQELYQTLKNQGLDVLLDDRHDQISVKFADAVLLGIPKRIVISEKTLAENAVEFKLRHEKDARKVLMTEILMKSLKI